MDTKVEEFVALCKECKVWPQGDFEGNMLKLYMIMLDVQSQMEYKKWKHAYEALFMTAGGLGADNSELGPLYKEESMIWKTNFDKLYRCWNSHFSDLGHYTSIFASNTFRHTSAKEICVRIRNELSIVMFDWEVIRNVAAVAMYYNRGLSLEMAWDKFYWGHSKKVVVKKALFESIWQWLGDYSYETIHVGISGELNDVFSKLREVGFQKSRLLICIAKLNLT